MRVRAIMSGLCAATALATMPAAASAQQSPAASSAAAAANAAIVKQIEALEIRVVKAHTLEDFRELFDPDIEYYTPAYYSRGFGNFLKDVNIIYPKVTGWDVPILDMHIIATDNMATASSVQVWNSTYADTGKPAIRHFYRQTNVWMKRPDGSWRVVQAHVSVPIDPLTERILCIDAGQKCTLPNFPHRTQDAAAVQARNAAEAALYNPGSYKEGRYKPGD